MHGSHVAARDDCLSLARAVDRPTGTARYRRMFPGLEPLGTDPRLLMRAGGMGESATLPRSWNSKTTAMTPPRRPGGRSSGN